MLKKSTLIETHLLQEITAGSLKLGDRIHSRHHLARNFDCSRSTVEQAIRSLTEAGFVSSSRGSGTFVCANTAERRIERIFVVGGGMDAGRTLSELLFPKDELSLPLTGVDEKESAFQVDRLAAPGSAVIWLMPSEESLALMAHLERKKIPQLLVNRQYRKYDCVYTAPEPSIREGLSWLMIEAGRNLAFVSCEPSVDRPYLANRMLAFFRLALELGAHLKTESTFIHRFDDIPRDVSECTARLFADPGHPKGIFIMNEELALPFVSCAQSMGLRPVRDFFLLTFDLIPGLTGHPGIGMMRQQYRQLYLEVRRWLTGGFALGNVPFHVPVKTELICAQTEPSVLSGG